MNLYTVEQIELIRRLRQTGIQAEQILEAFRSLDRLEQDLGQLDSSNTNNGSTDTRPDSSSSSSFAARSPVPYLGNLRDSEHSPLQHSITSACQNATGGCNDPYPAGLNTSPPSMPILLQHLTNTKSIRPLIPGKVTVTTPKPTCGLVGSWSGVVADVSSEMGGAASSSIFPNPQAFIKSIRPASIRQSTDSEVNSYAESSCAASGTTPDSPAEWPIENTELNHLLRNGEESGIIAMKAFVNQYQIRQTTIARMTGVSQPYISKFLNGNSRELSSRVRMILFKWYLTAKNNPDKISHFCASEPLISRPDGGVDLTQQRRERYVFRPVLLQVLEHHFLENQYPDLQKRMEVAADCNRALAAERHGGPLMKKEHVTPQIVANWFANKRKDNKRRSANAVSAGVELIRSGSSIIEANSEFPEEVIGDASTSSSLPENTERRSDPSSAQGAEGSVIRVPSGNAATDSLTALQSELAAVNSSVLALVNPYYDSLSTPVKMEAE